MANVFTDFYESIFPKPADTDKYSLEDPSETRINQRQALGIILQAMAYIAPFKWRFAAKFTFTFISLLPVVIYPWPLAIITDHVIQGYGIGEGTAKYPDFMQPLVNLLIGLGPFEMLLVVSAAMVLMVISIGGFGTGGAENDNAVVGLAEGLDAATQAENASNDATSFAGGLFGYFEFHWMLRLSQALNHYYRAELFERIKALPMRYLDDQRIGDSIYRVMYDTPAITNACYYAINSLIMSLTNFFIPAAALMAIYSDAYIIIVIAICGPLILFFASLPFLGIIRRREQISRASGARTTSTIEEGMSNILAVQSLGGKKQEMERFDQVSQESFRRYREVQVANTWVRSILAVVGSSVGLVATYFVISSIIGGRLSVGQYGVILYYYAAMSSSLAAVGSIWLMLQGSAAVLRRVFFMMNLPAEEDKGTEVLGPITRGLKVSNATLVYPDGRKALDNISFEGKIGEVVAIVGPTGAGKTSLAYLIPRFHSVTNGSVSIDGHNVEHMKLESLRSQIAYVFQENHLFSDSIMTNIRYSAPDASEEEVVEAAKMAGAHSFISELPEGYRTPLVRDGSKLSVGQKQRISIARGLVRPARILILDEPTSAVDPETEKFLVESLKAASREKNQLVIIIAHRLSTIRHADKILFLDRGEIMESGNHEELMENKDGSYRRFVELQMARAT